MVSLSLRPAAQQDIQRTVDYYDKIDFLISEAFLSELEECLDKIKKLPKGHQKRLGEIRIAFLRKFPFGVHYKIYGSRVTIVAILHTRQDMDKWLKDR